MMRPTPWPRHRDGRMENDMGHADRWLTGPFEDRPMTCAICGKTIMGPYPGPHPRGLHESTRPGVHIAWNGWYVRRGVGEEIKALCSLDCVFQDDKRRDRRTWRKERAWHRKKAGLTKR